MFETRKKGGEITFEISTLLKKTNDYFFKLFSQFKQKMHKEEFFKSVKRGILTSGSSFFGLVFNYEHKAMVIFVKTIIFTD